MSSIKLLVVVCAVLSNSCVINLKYEPQRFFSVSYNSEYNIHISVRRNIVESADRVAK
jgi:hypothetical protein